MNSTISYRATQEQQAKDQHRRMAVIQSGHSFIVLQLIDYKKRRVSGIDELVAKPTEQEGRYRFEIVSRQLQFDPDPAQGGAFTAYVLYTDWNKKFLASHYDCGYWEIVSVISGKNSNQLTLNSVINEVVDLKEELKRNVIKDKEVKKLLPENSKPYDIANFDDDILEKEIQRRKKLQQKDVRAKVPETYPVESKPEIDINISDEEFQKLSRVDKAKITRARNQAAKSAIYESKKEDLVVNDTKDGIVQDSSPESVFLKQGVNQP